MVHLHHENAIYGKLKIKNNKKQLLINLKNKLKMSTTTTTFIILGTIFLVFRIISKFRKELKTDNKELNSQNLEDKFKFLIEGLNEYCYQGLGKITNIDKQALSIYKQNSCQIVNIEYGAGILTIIWKFKYFNQEMIYKRNLTEARDATLDWQKKALQTVISEFLEQYKKHEDKINASGIVGAELSKQGISEENYKKANDFLNQ